MIFGGKRERELLLGRGENRRERERERVRAQEREQGENNTTNRERENQMVAQSERDASSCLLTLFSFVSYCYYPNDCSMISTLPSKVESFSTEVLRETRALS